jgi:hypothetical protein
MASVIKTISFDAADALALAAFWAAALGSDVDEDSTVGKAFVEVSDYSESVLATAVWPGLTRADTIVRSGRSQAAWDSSPCVIAVNVASSRALSSSSVSRPCAKCSPRAAAAASRSASPARTWGAGA